MAKTLIISDAEIKALTQSSASDSLIKQWNTTATEMLCDLLDVEDLGIHTVTDERILIKSNDFIKMQDFPVDTSQSITLKTTYDFEEISNPPASYYKDPKDIRTVYGKDSSDNSYYFGIGYEVLASYTAGYTTQDVLSLTSNVSDGDTFQVLDNGTIENWTFKTVVDTEETQILIGVDESATLTNIAAKVSGEVSGTTFTGDLGVRLESISSSGATITKATVPSSLRTCVAYIAAGGISQNERIGGVQSYTLGQKTVSFADTTQARFVETTLKKYGFSFRKVNIY